MRGRQRLPGVLHVEVDATVVLGAQQDQVHELFCAEAVVGDVMQMQAHSGPADEARLARRRRCHVAGLH